MDNSHFEQLLAELETSLRNSKAPILDRLNHGNRDEETTRIFGLLSIPNVVIDLYRWKNGTKIDTQSKIGENWLFRMGMFMSSERAIECYRKKAGSSWDLGLLPLFESRGGEYYLIDLNSDSRNFGKILFHSIGAVDFDTIITIYDSLEALFETILECFNQSAYHYDPEVKTLEFEPILERNIAKKHNPKSEYWKMFR
jgi:hypothetical protein